MRWNELKEVILACFVFLVASASAQGQPSAAGSSQGSAGTSGGAPPLAPDNRPTRVIRSDESEGKLSDEQAVAEEGGKPKGLTTKQDPLDPTEIEDVSYYHFGGILRGVVVPTFIQQIFVDYSSGQGSTGEPLNLGVGGYFNWRKNGLGVTLEVWHLGFYAKGYYKGKNDGESEWEFVESDLSVLFGSFLISWAVNVASWFAIDIGFGLGFGGVLGDLWRTEAWRDNATGRLNVCNGPGMPMSGDYCENSLELRSSAGRLDDARQRGGTYQRHKTEDPAQDSRNGPNPHYLGSGGVPPIFFWVDLPRIALRFKP
ncbi:MAG: hypothetical protein N2515_07965, partial [Deltaproteobacteria bacterium]|nr:hypothetical protein [Deltaproteobacteria bacterium]